MVQLIAGIVVVILFVTFAIYRAVMLARLRSRGPLDDVVLANEQADGDGEPSTFGLVVVRRQRGFQRDRIRAYKVKVDRRYVGDIYEGDSLKVRVPTGEHQVQVSMDWTRSSKVETTVSVDALTEFVCRPGPSLLAFIPGGHGLKLSRDGPT